jgi:AraC-like DNA-binding protein
MRPSEEPTALQQFVASVQLLAEPLSDSAGKGFASIAESLLRDFPASQLSSLEVVVARQATLAAVCHIEILRASRFSGTSVARRLIAFCCAASVEEIRKILGSYVLELRNEETLVRKPNGCEPRVVRALAHINQNATKPSLTLDQVAVEVRLSRWHLDRLLRRYTGDCFRAHLRRARMERATLFLAEGLLSVKEIATRVGYPTTAEFDRQFRRYFHVTPTEWRAVQWANDREGPKTLERRSPAARCGQLSTTF